MVLLLPATQAGAVMIRTDQVVADMGAERDRISAFLNRGEVQSKMVGWGVDPKEADLRVASLSDSEVRQIASRLDSLPVGGEGIYLGLGALILIGVIIILLMR